MEDYGNPVRFTLLCAGILLPCALAAASSSLPQTHCAVAIDVGHSKSAQGAVSARGVREFAFNRAFANLLLHRLQEDGRSNPFILDSKGKSLEERTDVAARENATLLISIHHDSVQPPYLSTWSYGGKQMHYSDRFHGFSLFISQKNPHPEESLELAKDISSNLLQAGFTPSLHHAEKIRGENRELLDRAKGIYAFDDLIVLKTAAMPAVLLECGIIVNRNEEARLSDPATRGKMVQAVAEGIEEDCHQLTTEPR